MRSNFFPRRLLVWALLLAVMLGLILLAKFTVDGFFLPYGRNAGVPFPNKFVEKDGESLVISHSKLFRRPRDRISELYKKNGNQAHGGELKSPAANSVSYTGTRGASQISAHPFELQSDFATVSEEALWRWELEHEDT